MNTVVYLYFRKEKSNHFKICKFSLFNEKEKKLLGFIFFLCLFKKNSGIYNTTDPG